MIKTRLIGLLSDSKKYIVWQVIFKWLSLLCQIFLIATATGLLGHAVHDELDAEILRRGILTLIVAIMARLCFDRLASRASYYAAADVKQVLREQIYGKILRMGPSYLERCSSAELTQLSTEGVEQLETYFGQYLPQFFYSILAPLTLFLALSPISVKAALVLFICVPFIPVVMVVVQKIAKKLLRKYWDIYAGLGDSFLENLQGLTTLKIYRQDEAKAIQMDAESERFRKITMKVLMMQLNSIIVMDVVAYGGAAIGMLVAIYQYRVGAIALEGALMIALLAAEFFLPMRLLGSFFHIAMNGMAASDRMFAFLDMEEPKKGKATLQAPVEISMDRVSFSYEENRRILHGVSLKLHPGNFVCLVGASGCGKSTIAGILSGKNRGYTGEVQVNGTALSQIKETHWMKEITLVRSGSYLLRGTVEENLRMGNPDATEEEMWNALERVHLKGFLENQEGLSTVLKEGGNNFSGGQRQRLALARALLHDSACYIFDEATSNVDVESEECIMEVIRDLAKEKCVLLISHRLANVVSADRIYLLKEGQIAEEGTHSELLLAQGAYAKLYETQQRLEAYGKEA